MHTPKAQDGRYMRKEYFARTGALVKFLTKYHADQAVFLLISLLACVQCGLVAEKLGDAFDFSLDFGVCRLQISQSPKVDFTSFDLCPRVSHRKALEKVITAS